MNETGSSNTLQAVNPGCTRCEFAYPVHQNNEIRTTYICRFGPPQMAAVMVKDGAIATRMMHPPVVDADWCFQFAPRARNS
jgi:hypothetical protein